MDDLISRQDAIDALNRIVRTDNWKAAASMVLLDLPPVQPTQTNALPTQKKALDCISRQEAIDILDDFEVKIENGEEFAYSWARMRLTELPSAQPERKKGKWLVDEDGNMECPFCGNTCGFGNYCNECGADLRGE